MVERKQAMGWFIMIYVHKEVQVDECQRDPLWNMNLLTFSWDINQSFSDVRLLQDYA